MIFRVAHDGDADSETRRRSALRNRLGRIVGPFRVDIGTKCFEQGLHVRFVKKYDVVDRPQGGNKLRTRLLIEDRAAGSLECANAAIHIDADGENVALAASSFQVADVPDVKRVEAAVRKSDPLAASLVIGKFCAKLIARDDFGFGVAHESGRGSPRVAADGVEELLAGDGRRAALHHDQATGDIGNVCRFERRGAAGKREGVRSEDGVARPRHVDGLVAAVYGNLREVIAGFEKRHAVATPRDEERLELHRRTRRAPASN